MSNHKYTPTTEQVRLAHAESVTFHQMEEPELTEANSMFDRWMAARDEAIESAAEQRGAERVEQAVLAVLDDYTMPGKLHDPTGIAGAELETLEGYIREAITETIGAYDA